MRDAEEKLIEAKTIEPITSALNAACKKKNIEDIRRAINYAKQNDYDGDQVFNAEEVRKQEQNDNDKI